MGTVNIRATAQSSILMRYVLYIGNVIIMDASNATPKAAKTMKEMANVGLKGVLIHMKKKETI